MILKTFLVAKLWSREETFNLLAFCWNTNIYKIKIIRDGGEVQKQNVAQEAESRLPVMPSLDKWKWLFVEYTMAGELISSVDLMMVLMRVEPEVEFPWTSYDQKCCSIWPKSLVSRHDCSWLLIKRETKQKIS